MQQQLQISANGRTGDPGSGKWRLRSNTLGSINGGVHLQIYPCFFKRNMIWTKLPNLYFLWCSMWHLQGWNQNSNSISKLEIFCWSVVSATGGLCFNLHSFHHTVFSNLMIFWWVHLPSPAMHPETARLRTPWLRRTPMRRPKGGRSCECFPRVFSCCKWHGMLFFWWSYITCVAAGYLKCACSKYAACMWTNNIMI